MSETRMLWGRAVADWVSVSALLTGAVDLWEGVEKVTPFVVRVGPMIGRVGDVVVRELDGRLTVDKYEPLGRITEGSDNG